MGAAQIPESARAAVARELAARGLPGTSAAELIDQAAALLTRAHASRPAAWLADEVFLAHAMAIVAWDSEASAARELADLHAGDLFLACACGRGLPDAIQCLEREHIVRVGEFAASVDSNASFVTELTQQLRARLLVSDGTKPARVTTYSGRGSLGGWIRVSAVRLARDLARTERGAARVREDDEIRPDAVDPELGYMKRAYGDAVSRTIQEALDGLAGEARTLLKMHYVDSLSIEQVGAAFGVSRATSTRMLASARVTLLAAVRERLATVCGVRGDEADSLLAFVRSRIDVSLAKALRTRS